LDAHGPNKGKTEWHLSNFSEADSAYIQLSTSTESVYVYLTESGDLPNSKFQWRNGRVCLKLWHYMLDKS